MTNSTSTASRSLIQVVSGFHPDVDGMGDYARHLSTQLWTHFQIASEIVIFRKPKSGPPVAQGLGWRSFYAEEPSLSALANLVDARLRATPSAQLMLHYGPYAYTSNGLPLRFAKMMAQLGNNRRLAVFFHELWTRGWPWKRPFWTHLNQRHAVGTLLESSRLAFSSSAKFLQQLQQSNKAQRPLIQARIFSNMGELNHPPALSSREPRLIIFGQLQTRLSLYQQFENRLDKLCRILDLRQIIDAGSGNSSSIPHHVGPIPVERAGFLTEAEISALLATSVAGVVRYAPIVWEKSGVLAAYQAHGLVPVIAPPKMEDFKPFADMPFTLIDDLIDRRDPLSSDELQSIANRSYAFYQREVSLQCTAEKVASALGWTRAASSPR